MVTALRMTAVRMSKTGQWTGHASQEGLFHDSHFIMVIKVTLKMQDCVLAFIFTLKVHNIPQELFMFPYLTLHDATQTRNKNLLISHCYLTLALHTLLSPILVTITRTSLWNTKRILGLRCQMCSLYADKVPGII